MSFMDGVRGTATDGCTDGGQRHLHRLHHILEHALDHDTAVSCLQKSRAIHAGDVKGRSKLRIDLLCVEIIGSIAADHNIPATNVLQGQRKRLRSRSRIRMLQSVVRGKVELVNATR